MYLKAICSFQIMQENDNADHNWCTLTRLVVNNSSLMMSLGAAALKVNGRPNAISRGGIHGNPGSGTPPPPPQEWPLSSTITLNEIQWRYLLRRILTWENTVLQNHPAGREEREQESAMIRKNAKIDLLRSASKATMQCNTNKRAHKEPCNSPRVEWEKTAGQLTQV